VIIKFRNINNNQNNLYIDDINLNILTGINETLNGNQVSIYPNPTTGHIIVNCAALKSEGLTVGISDAVGRMVMKRNYSLPQSAIDLDLSSLSNGIYLIHLDTSSGRITQKLILNK
jgi:hypothetical protein